MLSPAALAIRPRNPSLHAALETYSREALELLDEYLAAGGEVPHVQEDAWERRGDVFVRERRAVPLWPETLRDLRESLAARPSWRAAVQALKDDPTIAPQLDAMIGLGLHRRRVTAPDALETLVARLAGEDIDAAVRYDPDRFARLYLGLEQGFYTPDLPFEAVAPLRNVRLEATPLFLGEDTRLVELSDDEVVAHIRAGQAEVAEGVVVDPPRFAIKVAYHLPKRGPEGPGAAGPAAAQAQAEERVDEVLRALTAFKAGRAARGAVLHRTPHWLLRDAVILGPAPRPPTWGNTYALGRDEAGGFAAFWQVLQSREVRERKSSAVALRRFHDACARRNPEDRLIDLLVTAEALALNVAHDSSDRAEMLHRLALRAGSSLAEHRVRREFDRQVRTAYKVRDAIVHGHAPELPALPSGEPQTLKGFIDGTEDLLRAALQRAIAIAAAPEADHSRLDWVRIAGDQRGLPPA